MDRVDSGFDASFSKVTDTDTKQSLVHRINTAPKRSKKPRKTTSDSSSIPQTTDRLKSRPASEMRPSVRRKSPTEPRRPSIGSSESSTARSRTRGHGSKTSSHRTSCTLVDPSRPARHYRVKSSQTVPTGDIDDVLALHFRSCSLFNNPTYHSPLPSPTISGYRGVRMSADMGPRHATPTSAPPTQERTDYIGYDVPKMHFRSGSETNIRQIEETIAPERANTTMHWMSPSTRKRQYEKMDKANSGLRGFVTRIVPRCVSGPPPPKFYENDKSDAGSVRRYRISDEDEEQAEEEEEEEHSNFLERSVSAVRRRQNRTVSTTWPKSTRWGCM